MDNIIKNDPTLDFFINGDIDWFNPFQIELRCVAIQLALFEFLKKY